MLVLSRKPNEEIWINHGEIRIKFIRHGSNGAVKIGIEAPEHIPVHRMEVEEELNRSTDAERTADGEK
jgi:carbon storage regulator CsrA